MNYTFVDHLFSDLHKDAYGVRPDRSYYDWLAELSDAEKQAEWDALEATMVESIKREQAAAQRAVEAFKMNLAHIIAVGGDDYDTALGWLVVEEQMDHIQDVEAWVYNQGFLFTDYGREVVEDVCSLKNIYYHKTF